MISPGCWDVDTRLRFAPQGLVSDSPPLIYLGHVCGLCLCV